MNQITLKALMLFCISFFAIISLFGSFPPDTKAGETWHVTTTGDDFPLCGDLATPCATIAGVFANPEFRSGDTVLVSSGVYTIGYDGVYEGIPITQSVVLSGGWDEAFVSQSGTSYIENAYRGITIQPGISVTIDKFHVSGASGVGLYNQGYTKLEGSVISAVSDSGIVNQGAITINDTSLSYSGGCGIINNGTTVMTTTLVANNAGCGISNEGTLTASHSAIQGSVLRWGCTGISNTGTIKLLNSSVTDNGDYYPNPGAGLCNFGRATIVNSTISGNQANTEAGGGIYHEGQQLALYSSTISDNQAVSGGGIFVQSGTVSIENTLIAQNTSQDGSDDCNGRLESMGYNLIGNRKDCVLAHTPSDLINVPSFGFPALGVPLPYAPIARFSPAIDSGDPTGCKDDNRSQLITDQRGVERDNECDIGAYEYDPASDPLHYAWLPIIFN